MQIITTIFQSILNLGAGVFLPIIMIILGLCIRMKPSKAISAALTLGVAFVGMNLIIGFMFDAISPAANDFVSNTGRQLTTIDMGWTPISAIAWAWPYAFLMFPLQITINIIMLATGLTKTLNVDMWNVWNKVLLGALIVYVTNNIALAFAFAAIWVCLELKMGDSSQRQVYELTNIPGVAFCHSMSFTGTIILPINKMLDLIPGINSIKMNSADLKKKIGIFGENHVLGFIVGGCIGIFAGWDIPSILTLAINAATGLTLFPLCSKLFMQALAPISDAAGEFMKKRFPGKEIYIGLDWPFVAGAPEIWVTMIILVPFILGIAIILPGNTVLPFGGIIAVCFAPVAYYICKGNVFRMILTGIITTPLYLWVGTYLAPAITDLALKVGSIEIPAGQTITWNGIWGPEIIYTFTQIGELFNGNITLGILSIPVMIILLVYYFKTMFKQEKEAEKRLGINQD